MSIQEITLEEVLENRERRVCRQTDRLKEYQAPVLSITMNIPGEVKKTPLIDFVFLQMLKDAETVFSGKILSREEYLFPTGPEALWVIALPAAMIKEKAMALEEFTPAGRLMDLDVIGQDGIKRSRQEVRSCIICGGPVAVCARSRAHGLDAVKEKTWELLTEFAFDRLAELAVCALVNEARLTPKPGLVDEANTGAHRDMDLDMLCASAESLRSYFKTCVALGFGESVDMEALVKAGLDAEKAMLRVTRGVNTHRGAIYALGIYLCALGRVFYAGGDVFEAAADLAEQQAAVSSRDEKSHGHIAMQKYSAGGAREEALQGFPTARTGADSLRDSGDDAHQAMLVILSDIRDTNLLYRGGEDALEYVQTTAQELLELPQAKRGDALRAMDRECIARDISPGGAADMLALAFLIRDTAKGYY